ncbi:PadR family transcriptional regulator [Streptomyces sp. HPF1205]|uniref:PadR family transcriptional regulator n=1 Tax=Streptomyces sp. HPF1205 TaxID=2873262 RepID=UPI001CEC061F|nr:PadR family transcriptional regulator [Streptomyces sp. HPF1205]
MAPVFGHGRLRLYLLKLLDESPRHGYEVIRLLEERFQGLYAPSAGTVYPRLAKLEKEGLVTHSTEGGRKVYSLTDAGRAELRSRADEMAGLEAEIRESVSALAAEIREDVRGAAGDLRQEVKAAAQRTQASDTGGGTSERAARRAWKEQARQAKEEAREARQQAKAAREAMDSTRDEVQRIAQQVQRQVQEYARAGDWQTGLREGLAELSRELGRFGMGPGAGAGMGAGTSTGMGAGSSTGTGGKWGPPWGYAPAPPQPAEDDTPPSADPLRDLERLLDRFRDDVRDAARDHGVDDARLREARHHIKAATAHIIAALRSGGEPAP